MRFIGWQRPTEGRKPDDLWCDGSVLAVQESRPGDGDWSLWEQDLADDLAVKLLAGRAET